ncbi:MAG: TPM domain-containing protein [Fibrobacter sp.]|jgi:uncharacterized protein|nr:TPM domain-containing protein [Fibrobacter sp.]
MKLKITLFLTILFLSSWVFAVPVPPSPENGAVYDEARLLSAGETQIFNRIADVLYQQTGVAIAAAIFKDIGSEEARDFAGKVAHAWGVGGKTDEGILIFIALDQKRRSVEVGYGAEGYLPDALVERLQQETLVPAFRRQEYGNGILALAWSLAEAVAKEKNITLSADSIENFIPEKRQSPQANPLVGLILIILIVIIIIKNNKRGGRPGGRIFIPPSVFGGGFGAGYGGSRRGSAPGSFGGFGGGRFGGGGSGGSW